MGKRLGQRAIEKRLALARHHKHLETPEGGKGWLVVPADAPATVGLPQPVVSPPATVTRSQPAVVISATGPVSYLPPVEASAIPTPETTTAVCTVTTPATIPTFIDPLLEQIDERAAMLEFDAGIDRETADRLAREMVMGRGVVKPLAPAATVGVDHASLAARLHPLVDLAARMCGGTARLIQPEEDPFSSGWGVRAAPTRSENAVCPCGSEAWEDVTLHDRDHAGQSVRRDCARCGKFIRHVRWYGRLCGPPPVFEGREQVETPPVVSPMTFLSPPEAVDMPLVTGPQTVCYSAVSSA